MSTKNVSLKQIANEFNVSINTVSHALRDMDDISEELKSKIRKKALDLGYMPNRVAQSMAKDEKPVFAIAFHSFDNLYFNTFINEFTKIAREDNQYDFLFLSAKKVKSDIIKQCILQRIDLLVTHMMPDRKAFEYAALNNIQIMFIGGNLNDYDMDNITIDNVNGCLLAAEFLTKSCKKGKFLYIGHDTFLSPIRYSIFRNEVKNINENFEVQNFDLDKKDINSLYDLIKDGYRKMFFYNDEIVYSVIKKLKEIDPHIMRNFPDIKIIGFDGLCEYINGLKQINTIKIDYKEFALQTYKVVKYRLENPTGKTKKITIPVTLHLKNKKE